MRFYKVAGDRQPQAQALWDEFTEKKYRLLQKTHTEDSPWWIIRSDDKHLARRETLRLILKSSLRLPMLRVSMTLF